MEDILYVKVEQNMVVQKKTLTYEDIATCLLYTSDAADE